MSKIPVSVIHYGRHDARIKVGGVETFARNLGMIFEDVDFMTPDTLDVEWVDKNRPLVICDNQFVTDWPDSVPLIGFQHGVAAVKYRVTKKRSDRAMAVRQSKAASRPNTLWVACARWISDAFARLYGNQAEHVVYHPVDLNRFDGMHRDVDPKLILHDARTKHKGKRLVEHLRKRNPNWSFQSLDCKPSEVPQRMRSARAFLHLSRYEGNSLVCNEAMAMNMPCMFTKVGLMKDADGPDDVFLIDPDTAFSDARALDSAFDEFTHTLETRTYRPRNWIVEHASRDVALAAWGNVVKSFTAMSGWDFRLENRF